ncbi:unnamed protein product [Thlaspi arvense]|uniref:Uncharacterized protein n=1 Tax=Thlaspi arvense TaxID=13288 RepID=A0AAU9STH8_THLAR|nr:unnamed protein product [Thlaspi arvense]
MIIEMISGERNKNFETEGLPAFAWAWRRWVEGEPEKNAATIPTINSAIVGLARDGTLTIPKPREAAFVTLPLSVKPTDRYFNKSKDKDSAVSVDEVSITLLIPRCIFHFICP